MGGPIEVDTGLLAPAKPDPRGVRIFKGIPYAAPPIGDRRWQPPVPPTAWSGVRPTAAFGHNAAQGQVFSDIDPNREGTSEDCLYLNIWTPDIGPGAGLPVLFWIHGGGFAVGHGAEPRYHGANLASKGIVVVTVNHRLGAFGFMAHPELTADSPDHASGNYGLLDLVAALRWVERNIPAFGGDPRRVTIAGESAGSMAVSGLMASPLATGLFAAAIGQSGGLFPAPLQGRPRTLAEAEQQGVALATELGVGSIASLRQVATEEIVARTTVGRFWPIVDGHFLPAPPADIFAGGRQNDVPLVAGWENRDEGFNFDLRRASDKPYPDILRARFGDRAEALLKLYPGGSTGENAASARELGGDLTIGYATWAWLEAQRQTGRADLFRYRFDRAPVTPDGWFGPGTAADAGAFHAAEIAYALDNLDALPWRHTKDDRAAAAAMSAYWINFIETGNPNGPGLAEWPSYRRADFPVMHIDGVPAIQTGGGDRRRFEYLAT